MEEKILKMIENENYNELDADRFTHHLPLNEPIIC